MHWTALLTKREFSEDARLTGDLECIGCGYNLRSARVGGLCAECGLPVTESMFELAQPDLVAIGFRRIALSMMFLFALIIPPIIPKFMGMDMFLLVGGILMIAELYRFWGSATLRFRASLVQLPIIGPRLKVMFALNLIQLLLLGGAVLMWYIALASATTIPGSVDFWKWFLGGAWLALVVLSHIATIMASLAMANMLGYEACRKDLFRSIIWLATSPFSALLVMIVFLGLIIASGNQLSTSIVRLVGIASLILIAMIANVYGITAGLRLAGAALHERDTPDDLVDMDRGQFQHRSRTTSEELPDIKLQ
ncbi:MAG: hypothetical protein O7G85_14500 [Planctomycetota bacterium]|nr:hypothetical protein [Planctomycetota bacterium]